MRYLADRPADLREARPWHRLAHIVTALPRGLAQLAAALEVPPDGRVLDYGCADTPYRDLFAPSVEYLAADLPGNAHATLEIRPDGTVPVEDASVDAVLSTQVLEHVADPALYLRECARVLKPGGRLLLSTHGFMVWHPDPVDLWRWTGEGLQRAVADAGLEVERLEGIMGLPASGLQLVQDAYYWRLPRMARAPFALVLQTLIRLADRFESPQRRRMNALVYALVARRPPPWAGQALLRAFADAYPEATFAEIGANDGLQHDHLRPFILERAWRGVMVEPVPYVFERLRTNLAAAAPRVALVQAAIAPEDGSLPFYFPRDAGPAERVAEGLPDWYDGIGSFSREAVLAHAREIPDIAERLVETEVEALSFATLRARHGLDTLDLLVIDTEGHDWEVLQGADLAGVRLVIYEHFHLSPADRAAARAHLTAAGFATLEEGFDTLALRTDRDDAVTRAWRELTPFVGGVYAEDA